MKTPIAYYGGKQRMAPKIIELMPKHLTYVEPFCGGGAVLFRKPHPQISNYKEVLNDTNKEIYNLFLQLRDNGLELQRRLSFTPFSEEEQRVATKEPKPLCDIERARRYFVALQQSYLKLPTGGWGRAKGSTSVSLSHSFKIKVDGLKEAIERLKRVEISCCDAIKCINSYDSPHAFFYCDPPYVGTDQGHYYGYKTKDFQSLIDKLSIVQGASITSCFDISLKDIHLPEGFTVHKIHRTIGCHAKVKARMEVLLVKPASSPLSPEAKKIYESGVLDCFPG